MFRQLSFDESTFDHCTFETLLICSWPLRTTRLSWQHLSWTRILRWVSRMFAMQKNMKTRKLEDAAAAGKVLWSQDPWTGLYRIQPWRNGPTGMCSFLWLQPEQLAMSCLLRALLVMPAHYYFTTAQREALKCREFFLPLWAMLSSQSWKLKPWTS